MSNPTLFKPVHIHHLALPNRIIIAPMCQYSAENGCMNEWPSFTWGSWRYPARRCSQ
jgi:2,4-dienoyl-CoA reductase-like NADH-dependent reductase (Old Yellow Enzyme family)